MNISKVMGIHINNVSKVMGVSRNDMVKLMGVGTSSGGEETGGDFYSKTISQSCRFNDDDSAYLSWTPGSAGNRKAWTYSCWVKRGEPGGSYKSLFSAGNATGNRTILRFLSVYDGLAFGYYNGSWAVNLKTTPKYRDPGSWYHIVCAVDTTQATASDRVKLYVNGEQVTDFSTATYPTLDMEMGINSAVPHGVGVQVDNGLSSLFYHHDGYFAEVHFLDGIAASATDFGQFQNGVWVPKEYTGTYGENGFHLDFANSADLGNDVSGNNNDFTSNNLASTDQMTDTPTNNYCVWNVLDRSTGTTLTEANTKIQVTGSNYGTRGTHWVSSGKWYWEVYVTTGQATLIPILGIATVDWDIYNTALGSSSLSYTYYGNDGNKRSGGSSSAYGDTYGNGDIIGVALDLDNGKIWFSKNGTWQASGDPAAGTNEAFSSIAGSFAPAVGNWSGAVRTSYFQINAGQDSQNVSTGNADGNGYGNFEYAPPTGFLALCSANLSDPAWMSDPTSDSPKDAFSVDLYTGDGSGQSITGLNFSPDLVWLKDRDAAQNHAVYDTIRGATNVIYPDSASAEADRNDTLTAFDANGFTIGSSSLINHSGNAYIAWSWLESATYGIDIVSYVGTGTAHAINHNLGVTPSMMIVKDRTSSGNWLVYHSGVASDPETDYLALDVANAAADNNTIWNDTAPTSTQFTVGTTGNVNTNGNNYIAYLFAEVEGFSKFGYYEGNGSTDGPFIYCGFKPAFVIAKRVNGLGDWEIFDSERSDYNVANERLMVDTADAEGSIGSMDILSNGFKIRLSSDNVNNASSRYVYMAFAEFPFKYATAR